MAELALGTVQFGSDYGVSNQAGRPSDAEIERIVARALAGGVQVFDTAPSYGSEGSLGAALGQAASRVRLITKTLPLRQSGGVKAVIAGFRASLGRLGVGRVDGLLVHHAGDLLTPEGSRLAAALRALREEGTVTGLGMSVYDGAELEQATRVLEPDLVQLPLNVLDRRLLSDGSIARLAQAGVEVHARSAFLQGALLCSPENLPPRLAGVAAAVGEFAAICRRSGVGPLEGALSFCLRAPVDAVVVGVNKSAELEHVLTAASNLVEIDLEELGSPDPRMLDPRNWT